METLDPILEGEGLLEEANNTIAELKKENGRLQRRGDRYRKLCLRYRDEDDIEEEEVCDTCGTTQLSELMCINGHSLLEE